MPITAELVVDAKAQLGEGPVWYENALWWVDINGGLLNRFDPASGRSKAWNLGEKIGAAVPASNGQFAVALESGLAFLNLDTGKISQIANPEPDRPHARFNDGKCDPAGRFWAGTLDFRNKETSSLYRLDADLSCHRMIRNVTCSNGIAWNAAGDTMYYIDTPKKTVDAFDHDGVTGTISNRRVVIDCKDLAGGPDGMSIDVEDMLWVAFWGGGHILRMDPKSGKQLLEVMVPSPKTTSCCFGGPELKDLYITTARENKGSKSDSTYPNSGGLFRAPVEVAGTAAIPFRCNESK